MKNNECIKSNSMSYCCCVKCMAKAMNVRMQNKSDCCHLSFLIFVYTHLIENQPEETGNAPNLNVHVGNLIDMESTGEHSELDFGDSSGSEYCPIPEPNVVDKPNRYQKIATETENVPEDILEISGSVSKEKRKDEST